jgi:uncharacterized protein (DUF427 family)
MPKAIWNGVVIAEAQSNEVEIVEHNVYFPPERVKQEYLQVSAHTTLCPWKGVASYYNVVVDGQVNGNAAWYYATPSDAAQAIKNRIAFWHGVEVQH